MPSNVYIENYLPGVGESGGILTKKPINLVGAAANLNVGGNLVVTGTITSTAGSGATTITATSIDALAVGSQGTTNPALQVDTSGGVTDVTGLYINANAAGSGLALATQSSGTNENLTIDAKGSGTVTINGTATGIVVLPAGTTIGGSVPLTSTITSSSATAFQVGPNGATNPAFLINASGATGATGISVANAAAGSGAAIATISSGTNESATFDAKGTGTLGLNTLATTSGVVNIGNSTSGAGLAVAGKTIVTSASSQALAVGRTGGTNPQLSVNANTAGSATGVLITGAAAGSGLAVTTTSSGTNENLTIAAKGSGTITFNPATVATAGGSAGDGIMFGSLGVGNFTGTGAPTFSAMNGSTYTNSAATTSTTRIYVNNSGAGTAGTTWTNLTTAA